MPVSESPLVRLLHDRLNQSFGLIPEPKSGHIFLCVEAPEVQLMEYMNRISFYLRRSEVVFITAVRYIYKISDHKKCLVTPRSLHRLFFTAVVIAFKFHEDKVPSISCFAQIGGVTNKSLIDMEIEFMKLLDWNAFIDRSDYLFLKKNLIIQP